MKSGLALVVFAISAVVATTTMGADKRSESDALPETISKQQIFQVVRKHIKSIKECINEQLNKDPQVTGTLLLSFSVSPYGRIKSVRLLSEEHRGTYVHDCVFGIFKKMEFPKFNGNSIGIRRIPIRIEKQVLIGDEEEFFGIRDACASYKDEGKECYHIDEKPVTNRRLPPPLSNADVLAVMRSHISEFKECMRNQMKKDPSVRGKMAVAFVVDPSGRVSDVQVTTLGFRGTIVGNCVSRVILGLKFPKFTGKPKEVSFPFSVK